MLGNKGSVQMVGQDVWVETAGGGVSWKPKHPTLTDVNSRRYEIPVIMHRQPLTNIWPESVSDTSNYLADGSARVKSAKRLHFYRVCETPWHSNHQTRGPA